MLSGPVFVDSKQTSLAARNSPQGYTFGLPSGQAAARELDMVPLSNDTTDLAEFINDYRDAGRERPEYLEAPLWYYVLAEAREYHDGDRLGSVGCQIVVGIILGLIDADLVDGLRKATLNVSNKLD